MTVKTGQAWAGSFVVLSATGALETPSSGPAGTLYVNGASTADTVTITGTNPYKWAVTLPTLAAGDRVEVYITATVSGIATASFVAGEQADTYLNSDLGASLAAGVNMSQISGDSVAADNLEAILDGTGGVALKAKSIAINNTTGVAVEIYGHGSGGHGLKLGSEFANGLFVNSDYAEGAYIGGNTDALYVSGYNRGIKAIGQTGADIEADITGSLSGTVGSLAAQAKADVNAEVVDALNVDTYVEPGQGTPAATASLATKISYLFKAWLNKKGQTSTTYSLYNSAGDVVDQKATVSDNGTETTKSKIETGP